MVPGEGLGASLVIIPAFKVEAGPGRRWRIIVRQHNVSKELPGRDKLIA